jgi:Mu-like prophage I protein
MPWKVEKKGNEFCVMKDTGAEVACHPTRAKAIKHMRALYANVKDFNEMPEIPIDTKMGYLAPVKAFTEVDTLTKEIMAVPFDAWDHPVYGMTVFDRAMAETMKVNFDMGIRGQDIATDYDHGMDPAKGGKASGWVKGMRVGDDGLYWTVEFTEEATKELSAGEWRYFSPEWFDTWQNPMAGGGTYSYVAVGGALTNKPWIKGMVPLNFSEVMVEKEGGVVEFKYAKFEKEGTQENWVSEDDGVTWRYATDDELKNESVEWEHSEPGTGSPPEPRKEDPDEDRSGRRDDKDGIRVDYPFREPTNEKEGSEVKFDKEFLAKIGITDEEMPADKVAEHIVLAFNELAPLREAAKQHEETKKFAELFPEEHAEMMRLRAESLDNQSRKFSERFERLEKREGDTKVASTKGYSALVLDLISTTHRKFSEGASKDDQLKAFSELMDAMNSEDAIVDYGESGSAKGKEDDIPVNDPQAVSAKFAEKAQEIAARDNLDWDSAVKKVFGEHPELAKAYSDSRRRIQA